MSSILLAVTNVYNLIRGFFTFKLQRSLRFDGGSWLTRTPSSSVANTKVTVSLWFKRSKLAHDVLFTANSTGTTKTYAVLRSDGKMEVSYRDRDGGNRIIELVPTQRFNDLSAWHHMVLVFDANQTQNDRLKLYINGVRVTEFDTVYNTSTAPRLWLLRNVPHYIGALYYNGSVSSQFNGYMADIHVVNGASGTPPDHTAFGEFKENVWVPKQYTGSYGNNGFHLDFSQSATDDSSGNNNDFTAGGSLSGGSNGHDLVPDTPTNNFATLNPDVSTAGTSISNGALIVNHNSGSSTPASSTIGLPTSGKYYFEVILRGSGMIGMCNDSGTTDQFPGKTSNSFGIYPGRIYNNNSYTSITSWPNDNTDRTIGMAIDRSNGKMFFHVNGTWTQYGNPNSGGAGYSIPSTVLSGTIRPFVRSPHNSSTHVNFGQDHTFSGKVSAISSPHTDAKGRGEFRYAPPTGYLAVCAENLSSSQNVPIWPLTARPAFSVGQISTAPGSSTATTNVNLSSASGFDTYLAFVSSDGRTGWTDQGNYTQRYYADTFNGYSLAYFGTATTNVNWLGVIPKYSGLLVVPIKGRDYHSFSNSSINNKTPPAIAVNTGDVVVIALYLQDEYNPNVTPPSGYSLIGSVEGGVQSGKCASVFTAYKVITSSGTETPGAWTTNASGADVHFSQTIRLT